MTVVQTELLEAILNSIDEAIHVVDENGVTIFYNHNAAEMDGMKQEEVLGKYVLESFPSLTVESSTLFTVLKTGKPIIRRPQRFQNKKGKYIETINTTLPIYIGRKIAGAVEIGKNYSSIQALTEQITKLQMKIASSKKKKTDASYYTLQDYLTVNEQMIAQKKEIEKVAKANVNVLIYGETGTGKELIVQGIHHASNRRNKAFIVQNCAAIPEQLLEGILFGTTKGSYTGAVDRPGLFELANEGTLFLDELNSLPIQLQAKLLRVLEDGYVRRIGDTAVRKIDVRVIVAMNEHPKECVDKKKLREDLYFRIGMFSFHLLPLRERKEDSTFLLHHFLCIYGERDAFSFSAEALVHLQQYNWPGNVRELKSTVQYAVTICEGAMITSKDLPVHIREQAALFQEYTSPLKPLRQALDETEYTLINQAMKESDGNVVKAAKLLQIPRQTLQYKLGKQVPKNEHLSKG
ncbi:MAG: sigma-54 interaction domain-containing protein [Bacillaceae bacterium]